MRKEVRDRLNKMSDAEYQEFSASLIPVFTRKKAVQKIRDSGSGNSAKRH